MVVTENLLVVDSRLISRPADFRYSTKEIADETDDPYDYHFKSRFLRARKIPSSFISDDDEGGYTVYSKKRKYWWSHEAEKYEVYKTNHDVWICTCEDFSRFLKPCKHIMKVVLFNAKVPDEKYKLDDLIQRILNSKKRLVQYKDTEYVA